MNINNLIENEHCLVLTSRTKTEAILELIDIVKLSHSVKDMENLKKEIFYREQIMSTGIGQGIAIPHVRFEGVENPLVIIGVSFDGIKDYDSLDGQKVQIIAMILVGAEQHKEYLRILSLIVSKLKDKTLQSKLINAQESKQIGEILKEDI
ncbi:MAG: PTS sugar transporter subunit IIA [Spirochaetaceae bacterium]|jgi:mannitol/fructose-specific phosphotransferase system IIA component (Ntr-type)|nr:PTS sugar transporter subunit IIA [Spirochaetaceae bacterium]